MRLPNGYGSVYKLSGKRRKPWAARVTTGWTFDEEAQNPIRFTNLSAFTKRARKLLQA